MVMVMELNSPPAQASKRLKVLVKAGSEPHVRPNKCTKAGVFTQEILAQYLLLAFFW